MAEVFDWLDFLQLKNLKVMERAMVKWAISMDFQAVPETDPSRHNKRWLKKTEVLLSDSTETSRLLPLMTNKFTLIYDL
jgi:hypothetical protein